MEATIRQKSASFLVTSNFFFPFFLLLTICRLKIMKERAQVKEKNLVLNTLEVSEVGFIETKNNVCSSEAAVALWFILYQFVD